MMNNFDRDNLHWYMSISEEERNAWALDMGPEHIDYMISLLKQAQCEDLCNLYDSLESSMNPKFTQARRVLRHVMAK
jgi:hypothetical protein